MLTKGSMVEYLPVGSQEAPQTIIGKKNFQPPPQNNIRTLLYLPWDKNSYSTSFKSQKFLILSAKRCVNIVNITKNIDSRTQIAL